MLEYLCKELEAAQADAENARRDRDNLLKMVVSSIETESYINPHVLLGYLKVMYPNSYKRRMEEIYKKAMEEKI